VPSKSIAFWNIVSASPTAVPTSRRLSPRARTMSPMPFLCLITHREVQSTRTTGPYLPCFKHMGIAVPVIESPGPSYFESQRLCNPRGSYFPNGNRICDLKQRILFFVPPCRSISPCRRKRDFAQNIPMFARTNSMSQSSSTSTSFSPTPNGIV
jgi:hypothetical protein